jgi:ParB family chromosome partitioning protein
MSYEVALSCLRPGHEYPEANINCRVTGRESEIDRLAAAIEAEGLLQPLLICKSPIQSEEYYVIEGNRRLAALKLIAERTQTPALPVSVHFLSDSLLPIDALRKSLVANDMRLPLHPVDKYGAFAQCHENGLTVAEIAARYAIPEQEVKKGLAQGRLAPVVRSAWRDGKLTAEEAQAFTLAPDHATQAKAFAKLKKAGQLRRWNIRNYLVGNAGDSDRLLTYVGRENYVAAGGNIIEDLFNDDDGDATIGDPALLKKLADNKLQEKCDQLTADGWSWASPATDLPGNAENAWQKLPTNGKKASADQKEKSGCIIRLDYDGKLIVVYAVVKPGSKAATEEKKKQKAKKIAKGEPAAEIPIALAKDLVEQRTRAAAVALGADIDIALAVLLAGFMAPRQGVSVSSSGLGNNSEFHDEDMKDALALTLKMTRDVKLAALAAIAAESLDFRGAEDSCICDAIPAAAMNDALQNTFAAGDYFERAPKAITLQAIEETLGKDAVKPLAGQKKSEIASFAARELPAKGWLPHELRTAHYAGTGEKQNVAIQSQKGK